MNLRVAGFLMLVMSSAHAREVQSLDADWSFYLGDAPGAQAADFDAHAWRRLDVPHDWSIELPIDKDAPAAGGGGFFHNGIGWYRRSFVAPKTWSGQRVAIEFDGVYQDAEVWINGLSLGRHPYGYTPFRYDLTPHLNLGADNVLAVRVDNSAQPNSRWYSGSGIYRHVRLVVTAPVHVAVDGVFASTTALSDASATVRIATTVRNDSRDALDIEIETTVLDPRGRSVATKTTTTRLGASSDGSTEVELAVAGSQPWSPETPRLYRAVTRVRADGQLLDEVNTPFGLRTVRATAERGLELNGRVVKLIGGNVHHDNGILGAVALDRAEERRVELLKAAGFNAVRTAHNPPSPAFLDACDRLGMLVLDEAFDGWETKKTAHDYNEFFNRWSQRDIKAMVIRDRNHPSVVLWSIGNEVFERGSPRGAGLARPLAENVRALDPTRPVAIGLNNVGRNGDFTKLDPIFSTVDVAGYNYDLARHAIDHARLPSRIIVATESYQSETFANWAIVHDTPYVLGDFVWSALDYLGEAGLGRVFSPGEKVLKPWEGNMWPWHGAPCGEIDLTGERKPASHYRNIVWDRGEKLYAAVLVPSPDGPPWGLTPWSSPPARASWTWPGQEGRELTVEVYSRHDGVRLYLNGKLLGEKPTTQAEQFKASFAVPYAPGEMRACGVREGREVEAFALKTAGAPAQLRVTLDRDRMRADGGDVAFATIEVLDAQGVLQPDCDAPVQVALDGPAVLAGLGNGDLTTMETYRANPHRLFEGRALAAMRSTHATGKIKLTVTSPGLTAATVTLESVK